MSSRLLRWSLGILWGRWLCDFGLPPAARGDFSGSLVKGSSKGGSTGKWNTKTLTAPARMSSSGTMMGRGLNPFCLAAHWGQSLAFLGISALQAGQIFVLAGFSCFGAFSFLGFFSFFGFGSFFSFFSSMGCFSSLMICPLFFTGFLPPEAAARMTSIILP